MVGFQIASQVRQIIFSTPLGAFHDYMAGILPDNDNGLKPLPPAGADIHHTRGGRNSFLFLWYPKFHIASEGGWVNDPNGLCYYKGRWHVFYQLHPYGTQWDLCHWDHVSSEDMVTWRREPIAFAPSLEQEKDGEFKPETEFRPWDCGHNFYAPQSFNTNGRQIMYGWTSPFVEPIPMQDDGWCGQLTLPREIMLVAESGSLTVTSLTLHHLKSIGLD